MAVVPDMFEIVAKGKTITVITRAATDQITIGNVNLSADQAAALARLINLDDGKQDLKVEIKIHP